MDVNNFIKSIPDLLIYFIPGFISIRIKEILGFQRKHEKFSLSVYSFLYSFVIWIAFKALVYLLNILFPTFIQSIPSIPHMIIKHLFFLLSGMALGLILAKLPKSIIGKKCMSIINKEYSPEQSPWEAALSIKKYPAHAKVEMKNGTMYYGSLGESTIDPDEPDKELILYDYLSYRIKEGQLDSEENRKYIKMDYRITDNEDLKEKVYINARDVIAIQITPYQSN